MKLHNTYSYAHPITGWLIALADGNPKVILQLARPAKEKGGFSTTYSKFIHYQDWVDTHWDKYFKKDENWVVLMSTTRHPLLDLDQLKSLRLMVAVESVETLTLAP